MNWELAIEINRDALLRIVAGLFATAGLGSDSPVERLPRYLRNAIYFVLRPAESATRRLIFITAAGMVVGVQAAKSAAAKSSAADTLGGRRQRKSRKKPESRGPLFRLIDPRKQFGKWPRVKRAKGVRLTVLGGDDWVPRPEPKAKASADDPVTVALVCRRLLALKAALDDLPKQAERLAKMRARAKAGRRKSLLLSPMRPGRAPGFRDKRRKRGRHEVHDVLRECQVLALRMEKQFDSS